MRLAGRCGGSTAPSLLDHLATLPLVFPAIILSVAFLHVFVNLPVPLYGTLLSVIIASSVRYLPYGMRYAYAGALQIHPELEQAAAISGARGASAVPAASCCRCSRPR